MTCDEIRRIISHRGPAARYKVLEQKLCGGALPVTGGAGTELKALLKEVGLTAKAGCGCNSKAGAMDKNGVKWCRENRDAIAAWLAEAAKKTGWSSMLIVGPKMLFSSWFRITEPFVSFVDEAIRRYEHHSQQR